MSLHFQLHHRLSFGDTMLLVGSTKSLGIWNPSNALPCYWTPDDIWAAAVDPFPSSHHAPSRFEFKFCIQDSNGQLHWEPGQNHVAFLPSFPKSYYTLQIQWGHPTCIHIPSQQSNHPQQKQLQQSDHNSIITISPNGLQFATSPPPTPANVNNTDNISNPLAAAVAKVTANDHQQPNSNDIKSLNTGQLISVVFRIKYKLAQGESLYVLGSIPELGEWNKAHSPPMLPIDDNIHFELHMNIPYDEQHEQFEYKYFTRRADNSRRWEDGQNRIARPFDILPYNPNDPIIWDDHWEKIRLDFSIYYPAKETQIMHITGDCPEIGAWFKPGPTPMKLGEIQMLETDVEGRKWKLSVWVNREQPTFQYRYILIDIESNLELWEREPNRKGVIDPEETIYNSVHILRDLNFVSDLQFDRVPPDMFIGPYPQTQEDVELMVKEGVTAVFNVQTDEDFEHRGIQWDLLMDKYNEKEVKVVRYQIRDFDRESLKERLIGATKELEKLIDDGKKVYIHCTAGMGRAPACAVAYLCLVKKMELDAAVKFVKKHRKVAVPNVPVLEAVVKQPYP